MAAGRLPLVSVPGTAVPPLFCENTTVIEHDEWQSNPGGKTGH